MTSQHRRLRVTPVVIGASFATVGIVLAVVGILRGNVPLNLASILIAVVISGGTWGLIAWAVATAAFDVESDIASEGKKQQ